MLVGPTLKMFLDLPLKLNTDGYSVFAKALVKIAAVVLQVDSIPYYNSLVVLWPH